jgi:hypothetical protein
MALFCSWVVACGENRVGGGKTTAGAATASPTTNNRYLNDGDAEKNHDSDPDDKSVDHEDHDADSSGEYEEGNGNGDYHDGDDASSVGFGQAANATDERAITTLVKRYYAAAAAGNGPTACSMMASTIARSLPEEYGEGAGPAYLRGARTCEAIVTRVFDHAGAQLKGAMDVTGVRVAGAEAIALLGSHTMSASKISVHMEDGTWKIDALVGTTLP